MANRPCRLPGPCVRVCVRVSLHAEILKLQVDKGVALVDIVRELHP